MTTMQNVRDEVPGWRVEPLARSGKWIMIFYYDGEARGSVEAHTEEERDAWIRATNGLNGLERIKERVREINVPRESNL